MFDFAWSEMAIIAVVALLVIKPKDLPVALRTAGKWVRYVRSLASEFQTNIEAMARESELADLRKQVEAAQASVTAQLAPPDLSDTILNPTLTATPDPLAETAVVEPEVGVALADTIEPVEVIEPAPPPPPEPYVGPMPAGLGVAAALGDKMIPVPLPRAKASTEEPPARV